MTVKVEIQEGESIQQAVRRLRCEVREAYRRQWYKPRPGSYDKPSYRRRRKAATCSRNRRRRTKTKGYHAAFVGLAELFAEFAPFTRKPMSRREVAIRAGKKNADGTADDARWQ